MKEKKKEYTEQDLLRLAKRHHNTKRTYLLVDPLQGKHLAVSPSECLDMLDTLGEKAKQEYPETALVIGFAETATAVGMAVAEAIGSNCIYVHTTREKVEEERQWIEFQEEHSHATEQKLSASHLKEWIDRTETILFVDDEISTGKTLINFVQQLKESYAEIAKKKLVAVSIINRVSEENSKKLAKNGIRELCLLKLPELDYTAMVEPFTIHGAESPEYKGEMADVRKYKVKENMPDPRRGVNTGDYAESCVNAAWEIIDHIGLGKLKGNILVAGTEECMYPAIILGWEIENRGNVVVRTHSTTRSPIGISDDEGYPIRKGYKLSSLYDKERDTYIYNTEKYDLVFIVTDSEENGEGTADDLIAALRTEGNQDITLIRL